MNNAADYAVFRLTQQHTVATEAGDVDWEPLLDWLKSSVTEIVGRRGGGSGSGIPLNTEALKLLEHIRFRLKIMRKDLYVTSAGDLINDVQLVWKRAQEFFQRGELTDEQIDGFGAEFQDWVARIEAEENRPYRMEITVSCLECSERWVLVQNERVSAVVVEVREGLAPVAECRACGKIWVGWESLSRVGSEMGAVMKSICWSWRSRDF